MDRMTEILHSLGLDTTFEDMTPKDYEQYRVDNLNAGEGNRNAEDGYNCPECKNKGYIAKLVENPNGTYGNCISPCKCVDVRNSIMKMKRSGLKDIIKDYTFDKYEATEHWQKSIKEAAVNYSKNPDGWFYLGGQSGAGKTHLCTAICREFLLSGKAVKYMLWRDDVIRLKGLVTDSEAYSKAIDEFKCVDVLYIDDLFKTGKTADNSVQRPTAADVNIAFEIINFRYNNPDALTIISSELSEDELLGIDEATGGRIYERAKAITIGKDKNRNYRIRKAVTI